MSTGNLPRLRECLIELHLPAFREHYAAQAALATQESLSYPRFLLSLSEIEVAERHERKIQRQRRASKLPWEKTLTALGPLALAPKRGSTTHSAAGRDVFGSCRERLGFR